MPSKQSDTLPYSPNSLPMVLSKEISTHGSQTSSPVAVNVWPFMEFSRPLFLSRLEFLKAVGPVLFLVFINDLFDSLENPHFLFADDSTPASSLSTDLDKFSSWSSTWNMFLNPDKRHTHDVTPKGLSGAPPPPPPHLLSQQSS